MSEEAVLCFSVEEECWAELLTVSAQFARDLNASLALVVLASGEKEDYARFGGFGADYVYLVQDSQFDPHNPLACADALVHVVGQTESVLVIVSGTKQSLEVAARASQRLGVVCVNDLLAVEKGAGGLRLRSLILSGRGEAVYIVSGGMAFATVAPRYLQPESQSDKQAEVVELALDLPPNPLEVIDVRSREVFDSGLERAEVVVDFGQGVKQKDDIEMIQRLANLMHGRVGCSRPIASEREWMPEFIGLSGRRISPRLCLMVGVSGAIQHMIGLCDAEVIAAINNDPNAAVFRQVDYGLIADLYEVVPALINKLERHNGR